MAVVTHTHGKYKGVIVSKTDMRKLRTGLQAKMKDIADLIIEQLSYIGEECIRIARENGSYNDITGNLRSSIDESNLRIMTDLPKVVRTLRML